MWTHVDRGRGVENRIFCGRHKWMAPYLFGQICVHVFLLLSEIRPKVSENSRHRPIVETRVLLVDETAMSFAEDEKRVHRTLHRLVPDDVGIFRRFVHL